ncbi:hypothetical protein FUA23_03315 [Neolewinella aurantiaca]|uniref:Aspartyl protease n=1 Tax=Neolewinella aurantiaca TaxID=2602767 RepID=A0A5C7FZW6_9BACT|nr:aspartyl protease family protein [Neolewinella aurantiaca]TXF91266.1 hypothetical protein FUA23_03315 [Neolewinella aurantiaca]
MLIKCFLKSVQTFALCAVLMLFSTAARTQGAVSFLKANTVEATSEKAMPAAGNELAFDFTRNMIFFEARVNGKQGSFILDTGAPTLLLNNRGAAVGNPAPTGVAAGGIVDLSNQRIESFEMGGRNTGKHWAIAMDLRGMEQRMGKTIDGFVGHKILRDGEVRIDFPDRKFQLVESSRKPRHEGRAPVTAVKFEYIDHLPVILLRVGKKKLRFAIDTGAGTNLIDKRLSKIFTPTGSEMNVQGLDGDNKNHQIVTISDLQLAGEAQPETTFVAMDLSHLQSPGERAISGILGSVFLTDYVVGIDYKRRKINLW